MKKNWIPILVVGVGLLSISLSGISVILYNQIQENKELIIKMETANTAYKNDLNSIKSQMKTAKEDIDYLFIDLYYVEDTTPVVNERDLLFPNLND